VTDFLHATRTSYDTIAAEYAVAFRGELADKPIEQAILTAFAGLLARNGSGPVADLGCGTGTATAYLNSLGVDAFGVDLSPGMLAQARRRYPGLRFDEGSMLDLDLPDGSLAGIASVYALMHIPTDRLPALFAELHRVLAPGGLLLLGYLAGDEIRHRTEVFGRAVSLDYHLRSAEQVAQPLRQAGFSVYARLEREPDEEETTRRVFLIAVRPRVTLTA
jgi:SAM-dependent methyltransferase